MQSRFKKVENPVTGKIDIQFLAKLTTELSETTLSNSNGKNYKLVTVEFMNDEGEIITSSASVYEGNYDRPEANFKVGSEYLCTANIQEDGTAYLQLSHLQGATARPDVSVFGDLSKIPMATTAKSPV